MLPLRPAARHFCRGAIAQLGERLLCKQEVAGSSPAGSTSHPLHALPRRLCATKHHETFRHKSPRLPVGANAAQRLQGGWRYGGSPADRARVLETFAGAFCERRALRVACEAVQGNLAPLPISTPGRGGTPAGPGPVQLESLGIREYRAAAVQSKRSCSYPVLWSGPSGTVSGTHDDFLVMIRPGSIPPPSLYCHRETTACQ